MVIRQFTERFRHFSRRYIIQFSHAEGMVDVSAKSSTLRTAVAKCTVKFPSEICKAIFDPKISLNEKGDIIGTAKLAGAMSAKRTSDLIPLCHQISLSQVIVEIEQQDETSLLIRGTVKCLGQTGVEMEALTCVSVAALTLYDMTKSGLKNSLGQIVISNIYLESKTK